MGKQSGDRSTFSDEELGLDDLFDRLESESDARDEATPAADLLRIEGDRQEPPVPRRSDEDDSLERALEEAGRGHELPEDVRDSISGGPTTPSSTGFRLPTTSTQQPEIFIKPNVADDGFPIWLYLALPLILVGTALAAALVWRRATVPIAHDWHATRRWLAPPHSRLDGRRPRGRLLPSRLPNHHGRLRHPPPTALGWTNVAPNRCRRRPRSPPRCRPSLRQRSNRHRC